MRTVSFVSTGILLLVANSASAREEQSRTGVVHDVTQCRAITDDAARLRCFDTAAAALAAATDARSIVVLDREEVKKTRRTLFGFPLPRLPFFGNDRKEGDEPRAEAIRQIDAAVTSVAPFGYGLYTLVLDEGGTWRTTEADRSFSPARGDKITIKRGGLGNYLAVIGKKTIRVERVR